MGFFQDNQFSLSADATSEKFVQDVGFITSNPFSLQFIFMDAKLINQFMPQCDVTET